MSDTEDPWQLFNQQQRSSSSSRSITDAGTRRPAPLRDNSFYHATSSSLRSLTASELGQALSQSVSSDWETIVDESSQGPHRICLAKLMLAEASLSYSTFPAPAVTKLTARCPAGALGPLLSMLSDPDCSDHDKLCGLLDTLALLLMDAGNMSIARDLRALDVLFGLLRRVPHWRLLDSAMPVFLIMSKGQPNGRANSCVETTIAVLYVLGRIATHSPTMLLLFKQRGAVAMLQRLLQQVNDEDAVLGILSLLESLSITTPPHCTSPDLSSTDASPTRNARGEIEWDRPTLLLLHGGVGRPGTRLSASGRTLRKAASALMLCEEQRHFGIERERQGSSGHNFVLA
ncbi:MAG: hypothetical protein WDW38_000765 [Sanguina aurantia]